MEKKERYVQEYIVNRKTMALLPIVLNDKEIVTRVIEEEDAFFVYCKPIEIIEQSCRLHGSNFFGRKEGTKELTGITHKAPIAISPVDYLYFFPTLSYSRKECAWLSHFHVVNNKELLPGTLFITFINGQAIKLEMSRGSFENQVCRTAQLRAAFEDRKGKRVQLAFMTMNPSEVLELTPLYEKTYAVNVEG
ncbi:competence protein [Bacillus manliponensis]|uniref:Competence protein n=1 Tax=Bacillus manliponensis TaxID=574376 RepID=A0A073K0S9_9BACI|nr:competence protein ComK [Bacillus manliponensis]KEK20171.1 competence protein [Bacillus manliponensis]